MALHGAKPQRGAVPQQQQYKSHGAADNGASHAERAIKTGGRVASQSPDDQRAVFVSMLEAAMRKPGETFLENKETGERVDAS